MNEIFSGSSIDGYLHGTHSLLGQTEDFLSMEMRSAHATTGKQVQSFVWVLYTLQLSTTIMSFIPRPVACKNICPIFATITEVRQHNNTV